MAAAGCVEFVKFMLLARQRSSYSHRFENAQVLIDAETVALCYRGLHDCASLPRCMFSVSEGGIVQRA